MLAPLAFKTFKPLNRADAPFKPLSNPDGLNDLNDFNFLNVFI